MFPARADVDDLTVDRDSQSQYRLHKIRHVDEFTLLMSVAPEFDRRTLQFPEPDFADQIKNEMQLSPVGMIARTVKRRGNHGQMLQPILFRKRAQADEQHPLRHRISKKTFDRL